MEEVQQPLQATVHCIHCFVYSSRLQLDVPLKVQRGSLLLNQLEQSRPLGVPPSQMVLNTVVPCLVVAEKQSAPAGAAAGEAEPPAKAPRRHPIQLRYPGLECMTNGPLPDGAGPMVTVCAVDHGTNTFSVELDTGVILTGFPGW